MHVVFAIRKKPGKSLWSGESERNSALSKELPVIFTRLNGEVKAETVFLSNERVLHVANTEEIPIRISQVREISAVKCSHNDSTERMHI